jgi:cytoskeletal protein RodZ
LDDGRGRKSATATPPAITPRDTDIEAANGRSKEKPPQKSADKTPLLRTARGKIILVVVGLLVLGVIVGGAVGGTVGKSNKNQNQNSIVSGLSSTTPGSSSTAGSGSAPDTSSKVSAGSLSTGAGTETVQPFATGSRSEIFGSGVASPSHLLVRRRR